MKSDPDREAFVYPEPQHGGGVAWMLIALALAAIAAGMVVGLWLVTP